MKAAALDACVLIDLANARLLDKWFQLGIETFTTDLAFRQVSRENQITNVLPFKQSGFFKVQSLTEIELAEAVTKFSTFDIGIEDKSVLYLASKLGAVLITGDRRVRLQGERHQLEVKGLLWTLDQLVTQKVLLPLSAAVALQTILDEGAYLPPAECEIRLRNWNSGKA